MSLQLHARTKTVNDARQDINKAYFEAIKKYDLTYSEQLSILSGLLADLAKWCIRSERHPDSDKRGDEA
jgi:hypothetical protein